MKLVELTIIDDLSEFMNEYTDSAHYGINTGAYQMGFKKKKSCQMQIMRLQDKIKARNEAPPGSKRTQFVVFLDLKKAYDSVNRLKLLRILALILPQHLKDKGILNILSQLLMDTQLYLEGEWIETTHGLPQGSCLSPVLFDIFIHYIFKGMFLTQE